MDAKDRWHDYVVQNFAIPGALFRTLGASLGDQGGNAPPEWGQGWQGFGQRAASEFGRFTIAGTIQSSMAATLREDTRFFRCQCRGFLQRSGHAISRTFITYDHNGHKTPDLPGLAGIYGGGMLMTYWDPHRFTPLSDGFRNGNIGEAVATGITLIREFAPDFKRLFQR